MADRDLYYDTNFKSVALIKLRAKRPIDATQSPFKGSGGDCSWTKQKFLFFHCERILRLYLLIIAVGAFGTLLIMHAGSRLPSVSPLKGAPSVTHAFPHDVPVDGRSFAGSVLGRLQQNADDGLSRFFLQLFVVISVSYSLSQRVFSMLVLMALVSTILTGPPLLSLFGSKRRPPPPIPLAAAP